MLLFAFSFTSLILFSLQETRPWDLRCPKFIVKPKPFGANPQRKQMTESGKASTCLRGKKWRFRRENECSSVPLPDSMQRFLQVTTAASEETSPL
jgi:hypothetical protein